MNDRHCIPVKSESESENCGIQRTVSRCRFEAHSASDASALNPSRPGAPCCSLRSPAAPIIAALSVDSDSGGTNTGMPALRAARFGVGAQPAVRRHAAGDPDAARAEPARRLERPIEQRRRRRRAGSWRRCRRPPAACSAAPAPSASAAVPSAVDAGQLAHEPQHRGLQAAEAEIDAPRDVGRQQPGGAVGCGALRSACVSRAVGKS